MIYISKDELEGIVFSTISTTGGGLISQYELKTMELMLHEDHWDNEDARTHLGFGNLCGVIENNYNGEFKGTTSMLNATYLYKTIVGRRNKRKTEEFTRILNDELTVTPFSSIALCCIAITEETEVGKGHVGFGGMPTKEDLSPWEALNRRVVLAKESQEIDVDKFVGEWVNNIAAVTAYNIFSRTEGYKWSDLYMIGLYEYIHPKLLKKYANRFATKRSRDTYIRKSILQDILHESGILSTTFLGMIPDIRALELIPEGNKELLKHWSKDYAGVK